MALNHIHYESIKVAREVKEKGLPKDKILREKGLVLDSNYKGDIRYRRECDSPWNDVKEEIYLKNSLLNKKGDFGRSKKVNKVASPGSQAEIVKNFLRGFKNLVEPGVLRDALNNDDKALSLALGQNSSQVLRKEFCGGG